jgi:plasmid maintenance system antidote protein VapI
MTIDQYLKTKGIKANKAAAAMGISRQTLWKARNGEISKKIAVKIEQFSRGAVKAVELMFPSAH